jgi:dolichyl-phosphate beta-glucosyltransferase
MESSTLNPRVSVIIPAYNESSRIGTTLNEISQFFLKNPISYELIVIDDGSTDDTAQVAEKFDPLFPKFTLIKNEKNRGKGYSVKKGMEIATGDYRLFMDADHSVKIDNLPAFLKYLEGDFADIVIGSIELPGSRIQDDNHGYRRILGRWAKILIRKMATPNIYDTQRGFKLFTKYAAETAFPLQTVDRWGFDIEILVIANEHNFRIKEVAVDWNNSRASSVRLTSYLDTFLELLYIRKRSKQGKYRD